MYKANQDNIKKASQVLQNGDLIIYPTDTLYSFGADASNEHALQKLNKIKNRQSPCSILLSKVNDINKFALVDTDTIKNIKSILPGPYTILLQSKNNPIISKLVQQESNLIGIRVIKNIFCNSLINHIGNPIITTSVNVHGQVPLTEIEEIKKQYNDLNIFFNKRKLDSKGSTILDFSQKKIKIIRRGEGKVNEIFD